MESLIHYIINFGYLALFLAVFFESGLFFGFFLPGDSLLFAAGLFAAKGDFSLALVCLVSFIGAVLGVQVGYWFGLKFGKPLYDRPDTFFFRKAHIEKTKDFYAKHGKKTIVLARFTPIVRTFAPIVAGVAEMDYKTFVQYNVIGAILWSIGLPVLGYFLGQTIPNIDKYLLPIIVIIIVASIIPAAIHLMRPEKSAK